MCVCVCLHTHACVTYQFTPCVEDKDSQLLKCEMGLQCSGSGCCDTETSVFPHSFMVAMISDQ